MYPRASTIVYPLTPILRVSIFALPGGQEASLKRNSLGPAHDPLTAGERSFKVNEDERETFV